jgi:curved DNA-binding protein CbpA
VAGLRPGDDPYRILGVLRGADVDQIKAAHRRLAKRFHPDRASGDEQRFLAVQEAYQLLSDPKRRLEWDRRHAPVSTWAPRPNTQGDRQASAQASRPSRAPGPRGRGSARVPRKARPPGQRTATWSAAHVPWWEDFRPRSAGAGEAADAPRDAGRSGSRPRRPATPGRGGADPASSQRSGASSEPFDLDAHSRSSGAAWSSAARRHFRRGDRDLPSRGAWRYRGTQVVTGAEARKVAAEESARGRGPRPAGAAPSTQTGAEDEPAGAAPSSRSGPEDEPVG